MVTALATPVTLAGSIYPKCTGRYLEIPSVEATCAHAMYLTSPSTHDRYQYITSEEAIGQYLPFTIQCHVYLGISFATTLSEQVKHYSTVLYGENDNRITIFMSLGVQATFPPRRRLAAVSHQVGWGSST